jgi:hypothetical protein
MFMKIPQRESNGERPCYTFSQMADLGFLWYLNVEFLNPQGYALCLDYADGETEPRGWSFHGFREPVEVDLHEDTKKLYRTTMRVMLDFAKDHGRVPIEVKEKTDGQS